MNSASVQRILDNYMSARHPTEADAKALEAVYNHLFEKLKRSRLSEAELTQLDAVQNLLSKAMSAGQSKKTKAAAAARAPAEMDSDSFMLLVENYLDRGSETTKIKLTDEYKRLYEKKHRTEEEDLRMETIQNVLFAEESASEYTAPEFPTYAAAGLPSRLMSVDALEHAAAGPSNFEVNINHIKEMIAAAGDVLSLIDALRELQAMTASSPKEQILLDSAHNQYNIKKDVFIQILRDDSKHPVHFLRRHTKDMLYLPELYELDGSYYMPMDMKELSEKIYFFEATNPAFRTLMFKKLLNKIRTANTSTTTLDDLYKASKTLDTFLATVPHETPEYADAVVLNDQLKVLLQDF
jgi:hypothetical protein